MRLACIVALLMSALLLQPALAGPPYETDDPEPVACHHLEVDYAYARQGVNAARLQTAEVDYGPTQNVELSLAAQGDEVELGSALRFISETKTRPQVSFLPAVTFKSSASPETFLPIWVQKSSGQWTVFGGAGFSRSTHFGGLALTRNFHSGSNVGLELFRETSSEKPGGQALKFNLGYIAQLDEQHALLLSAGRSLGTDPRLSFYVGYQIILAPKSHAANCQS